MGSLLEVAVGQLLALVAFFAFPAGQYVFLRRLAHREGQPQLWFLPNQGYRLVIRNMPRDKMLTDIRYRVVLRRAVQIPGASVATLRDVEILRRDDFFLFPGNDQILVDFQLERRGLLLVLLSSDQFGHKRAPVEVHSRDRVVCDYVATIENRWNFDVQVRKRVEINGESLWQFAEDTDRDCSERAFQLESVLDVS